MPSAWPLVFPRRPRGDPPSSRTGAWARAALLYSQGRGLHVAHVVVALGALGADALEATPGVDARGLPGAHVLRPSTLIYI